MVEEVNMNAQQLIVEREKELKRQALIKATNTKFKTAFIFALDAIEKTFGHLWDENGPEELESPEFYRELYNKLRKSVLDNGNNQIRNFEKDMEHYEVSVRTQVFRMDQDEK